MSVDGESLININTGACIYKSANIQLEGVINFRTPANHDIELGIYLTDEELNYDFERITAKLKKENKLFEL